MSTDRARRHEHGTLALSLLALAVGLVVACGAWVFRALIAFFHNLLFLGEWSIVYDATVHTPGSPWGALVILVPVVGAMGVAFLVQNFAPEAKGHGVPEVMDAIYYKQGIIGKSVVLVKSLASALSIGSGGSVGREGPIVQIGSAFGSNLGQWLPMVRWQRNVLIACGAGGGIAATFNTPIGGLLFAIEIMLAEVSIRTLLPVLIATASATYLGRFFFGVDPSFVIPQFLAAHTFHAEHPVLLLLYVGLGLLMGLVAAVYVRAIYLFEDFFDEKIAGSYYFRHGLGMLLVGCLMYAFYIFSGHYYVEGVGYATLQDILTGVPMTAGFLLLLCAGKLLATCLTLGSGASGGIFSPALFMGATGGAACGLVLRQWLPGHEISVPAFALAGMACVIGAATGAALTAIVMIFEMTLNYSVIIPVTMSTAVALGIRKLLCADTIYTLKLTRRGHRLPQALMANFALLTRAGAAMATEFARVPADMTLSDLRARLAARPEVAVYLLEEEGRLAGIFSKDQAFAALARADDQALVRELALTTRAVLAEDATLFEVAAAMDAHDVTMVLIADTQGSLLVDDIRGFINHDRLAEVVAKGTELF